MKQHIVLDWSVIIEKLRWEPKASPAFFCCIQLYVVAVLGKQLTTHTRTVVPINNGGGPRLLSISPDQDDMSLLSGGIHQHLNGTVSAVPGGWDVLLYKKG